jgi:hypothetical protein
MVFSQIEHLADVLMTDLPGELELVREPLEGLFVQAGFGPDELQGDLLAYFRILDFIDPAHAAMPQLLDDLVATSEGRAGGELVGGCLEGFCHDRRMVLGRRELGAATCTESRSLRIVRMTFRARDGHRWPPIFAGPRITPLGREVKRGRAQGEDSNLRPSVRRK